MKAIVFRRQGGPDVLEYADVDDPTPVEGEVVVNVTAAALNRLDVRARADRPEVDPMPHIGGIDVVGEIAEVGPGVSGWHAGELVVVYPIISCGACSYCRAGDPALCDRQRVFGLQTQGGLAERTVVPARNLVRLPTGADMLKLAAVPTAYATAWRMLATRAAVRPDDWVLIHSASGGVGSAALQIAQYLGARVIATASGAAKVQAVQEMGAELAVDYGSDDVHGAVQEATNGEGVHVVVDTVGADTWATSLECVRKNGMIVTCGVTSGAVAEMNIRHLYQRQTSIVGAVMGGKVELESVVGLVLQGAFTPRLDAVLPLGETRTGHEALEERRHVGKIVIDVRARPD